MSPSIGLFSLSPSSLSFPRSRPPNCEFQFDAEQGERRAQLVARVSDETPLVLERRLEPLEHVVERLGQA